MSLENLDKQISNLESLRREEEIRVVGRLYDHMARGGRGKVRGAFDRAGELERKIAQLRRRRVQALKASQPQRREAAKKAKAMRQHEAKVEALEKRGPHLRYLIAYYTDVDEPDMVARYEAELAELPRHLASLRQRLPQFQKAAQDTELAHQQALDSALSDVPASATRGADRGAS